MISQLYSARILSLLWFGVATSALVEGKPIAPDTIPKEVRDLVGTYEGTWTLFGIDERGELAKRAVWTDSITADKPETRGGRPLLTRPMS